MGSLLQLHRIIEWMIYEIKREEIANNYSVAHRKKTEQLFSRTSPFLRSKRK